MTNYTPGPWGLTLPGTQPAEITTIAWDGYTPIHNLVATVPNHANARLIAAAPELLAALHEATAELGLLRTSSLGAGEIEQRCRAAIAKAEGRG